MLFPGFDGQKGESIKGERGPSGFDGATGEKGSPGFKGDKGIPGYCPEAEALTKGPPGMLSSTHPANTLNLKFMMTIICICRSSWRSRTFWTKGRARTSGYENVS